MYHIHVYRDLKIILISSFIPFLFRKVISKFYVCNKGTRRYQVHTTTARSTSTPPTHLDSFVLYHLLLFTIVHCFHRRLQKKKVLGFLLFLCNHVTQITIATSVTFHTNATTKTF